MPARLLRPSLRRSLALSAFVVVAIATIGMLASFWLADSIRSAMERDGAAFIEEQAIADRIVAMTYQQQLAAYRYLRRPDSLHRADFRSLGDDADALMRRYLFHQLSSPARLQLERMKETHEQFEVVTGRAFDLASRGAVAEASARLPVIDARAAAMDAAVSDFLTARVAQRAELQEHYDHLTARVWASLGLVGLGLVLLGAWLGLRLHARVLVPLEQLADVAGRIQSGDPVARVPSQQYQELRDVAVAFNSMADSVQLSRETVEMQNEELRQSLEQLQDTQDELVQHEKLSAMGQMLAGLAHELNNPLGGILGMAQLLRTDLAASPHPEVRRIDSEVAASIERDAIRARDLVRSLLNFARKPTGMVEPVSLTATIATAVGLRAHAYAQAGKTLQVNLPPALFVMADAQKLQHAVVNLINNALDALTSGGGSRLEINAVAEPDDRIVVRFDDDGPGFADARLAFDAFYTTKPADRGTGLGLALVKQFVMEFGGTVTASNRPDGGARVALTLRRGNAPVDEPATNVESKDDAPVGRSVRSTSRTPASTPAAPSGERARLRVLVVDDEPSLREVQRRVLVLEGFDVLLAENGEQARATLARERVDLVISDLRMPGTTDGRALLSILAQEYPDLAARAIVVTGDLSSVEAARLPVSPDRVLRKPFTRAEYIARVRQVLSAG
jgi:Signal transduction histidine kinase regulating C4-dicarboxylate transport system